MPIPAADKAYFPGLPRSYGKKTRPGRCTEQELIALRRSMIIQAREVFCQERFPAFLNIICADCKPMARCPVDFYAASLS